MAKSPSLKLKYWRFSVDIENIAWAIFDIPDSSVNMLSQAALTELEKIVSTVEAGIDQNTIIGLGILSGKKSGFIVGADVKEFDKLSAPDKLPAMLTSVHKIFDRIENLQIPTAVGIHGFCLGGGLELSLACDYRIAVNDDATRIGFPEIKLGIFPGFGGTGRSMRVMGPVAAMTAMLTARYYRAGAARRLNLVDKLVRHRDNLRWEVRKAILRDKKSKPAGFAKMLPAKPLLRAYIANKMRAQTAKKANPKHYPAPYALIDLFAKYGSSPKKMLAHEIAGFNPLMGHPTAQNLRRVFFLQSALKDQANPKLIGKPTFRRVHVIGAGVMGGDIAAWCALRGMQVTLQDMSIEQITPALKRAKSLFKKRLKKPQLVAAAMTRLQADVTGDGIALADVVIEAIVENLAIKQKVFADLETRLKPGAIMATNTSSIPLEQIAKGLKTPARLVGLHFFNPVAMLPLVEIVQSSHNDKKTVATATAFALAIGKSPVIVKSKPGFLVNRVLMPYLFNAVLRLEEGVKPETLDKAALAFGMPMGPIELMDVVGLDIGTSVVRELGFDPEKSPRLMKLIEAGNLGRKTGQGFYKWQDGKPLKTDPDANTDLDQLGRDLLKPLVDECEQCVKDGIVASADLCDIGVILGTGFAPFTGGPLNARKQGLV